MNADPVEGQSPIKQVEVGGDTACASECARPSTFDARHHLSDETDEIEVPATRAAVAAAAAAEGLHELHFITQRQIVSENSLVRVARGNPRRFFWSSFLRFYYIC